MNARIAGVLPALGLSLMLGACASLSSHETPFGEGKLAQIEYGNTQDQVRSLAGKPGAVKKEPRLDETVWVYYYNDEWNYPSEYDVSFDEAGVVSDISTERIHY
jgi:outer membrane protein assembly factor BamE (lipoprotein component of BamABCDE complex)